MCGDKKLKHKLNTIGCEKISELSVHLTRLGAWFILRKMGCSCSEHYVPSFCCACPSSSFGNTFRVVRTLATVVCFFYSCGSCSGAQHSSKKVKTKRVEPNVLLLTILVFWSLATCSMAWPVGPVSLHSAPATPPTALPLYSFLSFSRASPVRGGQICGKGSVSQTSTSGLRQAPLVLTLKLQRHGDMRMQTARLASGINTSLPLASKY